MKNNTMEWADFYQRLPAAAKAGQRPGRRRHAPRPARHQRRPQGDRAAGRRRQGPRAPGERLHRGRLAGRDLQRTTATASRSTCTRWRCTTTRTTSRRPSISEPPTDKASLEEAIGKLQDAGFKQPFWMPGQWPAHLMFFSMLWQNGGEPYAEDGSEATFGSDEGIAALTWMREQVEKGVSPGQRRPRRAVPRVQERQELDHLGRHLADQRPQGRRHELPASPRSPIIGDEEAVWANSHHFFMTAQAAEDDNLSSAVEGVHRRPERAVQRVGGGRA